jgi:protein ImuA
MEAPLAIPDKIASLREALARPGLAKKPIARASLGHEVVDEVLQGGLARGALHEVFAAPGHETSATGFATGLALRLAGDKPMLWIGQSFAAREYGAACPAGLLEYGLDPSRLIFLALSKMQDGLRAAGDALTCASLGCVIIEIAGNPKLLDLTASRRLVLAAAEHGVSILLLRLGAEAEASAAETRWLVKAAAQVPQDENNWGHPVFDVSLVRHRQGRMGQWVMAWSCDNGRFETAKAAASPVVSLSSDRQAEAA